MLAMSFFQVTLSVLFLILCPLLVLIVLLQKGRGGGLGAAFGGAGSSAFGTRTGDVFTWITIFLVGLFLVLAVVNARFIQPPTDQVSPVFFNPPAPGNIGEETLVKLSLDRPGVPGTYGAKIYYTLDGAIPDKGAIPYEVGDSVPVKPGQTLTAIALRAKWDDSEPTKGLYGVEEQLPDLPGEGDSEEPDDDVDASVDTPVEPDASDEIEAVDEVETE